MVLSLPSEPPAMAMLWHRESKHADADEEPQTHTCSTPSPGSKGRCFSGRSRPSVVRRPVLLRDSPLYSPPVSAPEPPVRFEMAKAPLFIVHATMPGPCSCPVLSGLQAKYIAAT